MFSKLLCKNVVLPAKSDAGKNVGREESVNSPETPVSRNQIIGSPPAEAPSLIAFGIASRRRLPLLSQGDPQSLSRLNPIRNPIQNQPLPQQPSSYDELTQNIRNDPFCPDLIKQLPDVNLKTTENNVATSNDSFYEQIDSDLAHRITSQLQINAEDADEIIHLTSDASNFNSNIMGQRFSFFGRSKNRTEHNKKPKINFSLTWVLREQENQFTSAQDSQSSNITRDNTFQIDKVNEISNEVQFSSMRQYPLGNLKSKTMGSSSRIAEHSDNSNCKTLKRLTQIHHVGGACDNHSIIKENSKTRRRKRWQQQAGGCSVAGDQAVFKSSEVSKSCKSEPFLTQLIPHGHEAYGRSPSHRSHNNGHHHHHHHHHHTYRRRPRRRQAVGYDIKNIDEFLTKCSLTSPGNIPVVLSTASVLYQTRIGGYQDEMPLPLGMVVNAIFKKQQWLYVQTPHTQEGYVMYESCLPLGILPPCASQHNHDGKGAPEPPCWESNGDVFGRPCGGGNLTDSEKELQHLRTTRSEGARTPRTQHRTKASSKLCDEQHVDSLYLKASSSVKSIRSVPANHSRQKGGHGDDNDDDNDEDYVQLRSHQKKRTTLPRREFALRQTLLSVTEDFVSGALSVRRGDVVTLLACKEFWDKRLKTTAKWFYISQRDGCRGFIPAHVAGNGFL